MHVFVGGRIDKYGGLALTLELECRGYAGWNPRSPPIHHFLEKPH
jgi:hypothetical protein